MDKKNKQNKYEPPLARDLSGLGAMGGGIRPMGSCYNGPYPYHSCVTGPSFFANCGGGGGVDTSACSAGFLVNKPTCVVGTSAITACYSGQHQT